MSNDSIKSTSITLRCDWNGDFTLEAPEGMFPHYHFWFYPRDQWNACSKKLWELVKPAQGDPK